MNKRQFTNLDRLRILGEALHGDRWQNAVARDLGINSRQVHRWVSGQYEPHEGHIADLIAIAKKRNLQIEEAIQCSTAMYRRENVKWLEFQAEGRAMAVMKADAEYYTLILIHGEDGSEWSTENVRRIPVIAWNIDKEGFVSPITLMPWLTKSKEYLIEMPDGGIVAFGREQPNSARYFGSTEEYVSVIREVITPPPPREGEAIQ